MLENSLPKTRRQPQMPKSSDNQRDRFIEAARKAGASEDEADFDRVIKKVAKGKPKDEAKKD
jgi:hypothetical protein